MPAIGRAIQLLKLPFVKVGTAYNNVAVKAPMLTGVVTTVVKTSAADLFAQKVVEGRDEVDWRRHGMFVMFGFGYLGCWQYYLYNNLFVRWCAPITRAVGHMGSAPVKVFIDQCIHHPLLYFPCFYSLKGLVEGKPLEESFADYKEHLWDNCKALWMIWVPAQMVNFTVVPLHLRIPFVAGVSFAWTVVISVMRGAMDKAPPSKEEAAAPSMVSQAAAAAASAASGVARTSPISLQPLLNTATASADSGSLEDAASAGPVGLQQLVAGNEQADSASAPMLLR
ncbi:hypothetical protein CHLRE_02g115150v5 [Chlamydomonas reinhardtii]|uniref:Peroxisomal membrane protein n=1 Tax=Chlamydomonas reinhardtii TaxID=3055 RepID=A0A2K3E386_CHLRE|nr:uncharacterized protein CHLRE_02g115150v5 [Chlamydomonas reinhardtii]PNW87251.1 hypothetical protein CHLRE_02g115150v5 [Chlamydomonas reinhardtii]